MDMAMKWALYFVIAVIFGFLLLVGPANSASPYVYTTDSNGFVIEHNLRYHTARQMYSDIWVPEGNVVCVPLDRLHGNIPFYAYPLHPVMVNDTPLKSDSVLLDGVDHHDPIAKGFFVWVSVVVCSVLALLYYCRKIRVLAVVASVLIGAPGVPVHAQGLDLRGLPSMGIARTIDRNGFVIEHDLARHMARQMYASGWVREGFVRCIPVDDIKDRQSFPEAVVSWASSPVVAPERLALKSIDGIDHYDSAPQMPSALLPIIMLVIVLSVYFGWQVRKKNAQIKSLARAARVAARVAAADDIAKSE